MIDNADQVPMSGVLGSVKLNTDGARIRAINNIEVVRMAAACVGSLEKDGYDVRSELAMVRTLMKKVEKSMPRYVCPACHSKLKYTSVGGAHWECPDCGLVVPWRLDINAKHIEPQI